MGVNIFTFETGFRICCLAVTISPTVGIFKVEEAKEKCAAQNVGNVKSIEP